jgi:D-beta-D-heptose 7-phosphate kinase/D-beta-D-heptose 1-phosphate adenosyltransferase
MIQDLHAIVALVESGWTNKQILVVGDLMLDRYTWGDVERISPEAPVPVVRVMHQSDQPGGAGNAAMNIASLGGKPTLVGFCGDDVEAHSLEQLLRDGSVEPRIIRVAGQPTTTKLRIVGGKQQMLRLDRESIDGFPDTAFVTLKAHIDAALQNADAVVLSDYGKGVLTEAICQHAISSARNRGIPVLVDPKQRTFLRYRGATTICPNLSELSIATGISTRELDSLLSAGQKMVKDLSLQYLTATLSDKGIALLRTDSRFIAPAVARQVFDVSGAGDTVIATLALAMAGGAQMETAVQLANLAAGIAVSKVGTVPVREDELLVSIMPEIGLQAAEKVIAIDELRTRVSAWRHAGEQIVFTNGCFDLLHIGHITLLESARREGDRLVVGINSDSSVRGLKGSTRPIVGERERAQILASLSVVDAVIIFGEPTPLRAIEALRPDVIVKGGDYTEDTVVGAKEVRSWRGRVKIVPTVQGFSTTNIIAKAMTPGAGS